MDAKTVLALLDAISPSRVWIAGGWGIDALVGRQTRAHNDLDLVHNAEDEPAILATLAAMGFGETLDWRPVRFVLSAEGAELDLHPLRFAADGSAKQAADDQGGTFDYPAECFTTGEIDGRTVPCISVAQQVEFHRDYEPREVDLHDMAQLRAAFGVRTHF